MNKQYDERQQWLNSKYSREALIILMIALFVNAIIKSFYGTWAEPMVEMITLIALPTIYFLMKSVLNDSYLGRKESLKKNALYFGILGIFMTGIPFISYDLSELSNQLIVDGRLSDRFTLSVSGFLFIVASLIHIIKLITSKSQ